jgi:hypothetical protein
VTQAADSIKQSVLLVRKLLRCLWHDIDVDDSYTLSRDVVATIYAIYGIALPQVLDHLNPFCFVRK